MSVDQQEQRPIDEKVAEVGRWLTSIKVKDEIDPQRLYSDDTLSTEFVTVPEIEPELLREVLEHFGADFNDDTPERKKLLQGLKQKNNKWRRKGMDAVWGEETMRRFNNWTVSWANSYEENVRELPTVTDEDKEYKISGMRHLLGHLTALAAKKISWKTFEMRMAGRVLTGHLYATDQEPKDLLKEGYTEDCKFPGSIPPAFIPDLWNALESGEFKGENNS